MTSSFRDAKRIPAELLESRLESVKPLSAEETDRYEIVKDRETGEHYLLFATEQKDWLTGFQKEVLQHFRPLEHDDVLALIFGEEPYTFPEHWKGPYLRQGGEEAAYVWFDPSGFDEFQDFDKIGRQMREELLEFRKEGKFDEESVRRLLKRMDKMEP